MSAPTQWKSELWKPLSIKPIFPDPLLKNMDHPHVFYGIQPPEETYEVRGILPQASNYGIVFKDQD